MASGSSFKICLFLLFLVFSVTKSEQLISGGKEGKSCRCYDQCQTNFTTDSVKNGQVKEACQRGCRFFALLLHASHDFISVSDFNHAKDVCMTSCSESYINPKETSACNFGCSSMKKTDSCDAMEHLLPQITYALIVEESDILIHPGDPDPDDVLTDPGLRKQIQKTLETLLDSKPKLPEIHFRNLPIINKEISAEHPRTAFKCPKFYGFDSKLEFRNGKITTSDLLFLFCLSVFAMICFIVSRNLEKQRKLWKQLLMNLLHTRPSLMKIKDNLTKDKPYVQNDYPQMSETKELIDETHNITDNIDSKVDGITLVFYDDDHEIGSRSDRKPNINNFP